MTPPPTNPAVVLRQPSAVEFAKSFLISDADGNPPAAWSAVPARRPAFLEEQRFGRFPAPALPRLHTWTRCLGTARASLLSQTWTPRVPFPRVRGVWPRSRQLPPS